MKLRHYLAGLLYGYAGLTGLAFADHPGNAVWIDVRTPEEYRETSIAGHPNLPHEQIAAGIATLADKEAPVYLYCRSGRRADIAKQTLEQLGYRHIINAGGIDEVRKHLAETNPAD